MNPFPSSSLFGGSNPPALATSGTGGGRGMSSTSAARDLAEELNNWKLNCPLLYEYIATHVLVWPSLTVEVLPNLPDIYQSPLQAELHDGDSECIQTLLLGTHTSDGEDNSILIMDVLVPNNSIDIENRIYETHEDYGGFGYGGQSSKFHIRQSIPHLLGEPNKIRSMPQDRAVFATISVGGSVTVFDARNKLASSSPTLANDNNGLTTMSLVGHDEEGWGLSWSPYKTGHLATAADDKKVCVWDTQIRPNNKTGEPLTSSPSHRNRQSSTSTSLASSSISPLVTLEKHTASVQDVIWSPSQENILMSVGDDGRMILWDTRIANSAQEVQCSTQAVNTISISPVRPTLIATGGVDKEVVLWDYRKLSQVLYKMCGHEQMISHVEFCPTSERFIGSCGGNRSILVWDLYSIGKEQTPEDASDGPPELLFTHSGHSGIVNDFGWNPNPGFEQMIASVSDDNQLHLWCMSEAIHEDEDSDEEDDFQVE